MADISATFDTPVAQRISNDLHFISGYCVFSSTSYTTGGESLSTIAAKFRTLLNVTFEPADGYLWEYDLANDKVKGYSSTGGGTSGAGASHNHAFTGTAISAEALNVYDLDAAAATGVAVYLHTKDGRTGWFEFVSPTNADGTGTVSNGGNGYFIFDSDAAATDGVAIYIDEDAATVDERVMAVCQGGEDIYVPVAGSNQALKVKYNADPGTPGVAVYFDEDGANTYERLMFVSPTDTDGTGALDDTYYGLPGVPAGANAAEATHTHTISAESGDEIANATSLTISRVAFVAVGLKTHG